MIINLEINIGKKKEVVIKREKGKKKKKETGIMTGKKIAMDIIVPIILMIEIEKGIKIAIEIGIKIKIGILEVISIQDIKILNLVTVLHQNIEQKVEQFLLQIQILNLLNIIIKANQNQDLIQARKKKTLKKIKISPKI